MIEVLDDNRVFLDYGPVQMVLDIYRDGDRWVEMAEEIAEFVINEFESMIPWKDELKKKDLSLENLPPIARKMAESVSIISGELSPMAAVAGTFSDIAMEKALKEGADRAIINNGGDIALVDTRQRTINVALPLGGENQYVKIPIKASQGIRGVCTSGLGGRGFTKGVASAAMVLASNASVADACATYIGNHTCVDSSKVKKLDANKLDAQTDIPGEKVTVEIGSLSEKEINKALLKGLDAGEKLYQENKIKGLALEVAGEIVVLPDELPIEILKS